MFHYISKEEVVDRTQDKEIFQKITQEMEKGIVDTKIWGQALQNTYGDDERAISFYIQYRYNTLRK